MQGMTQWVSGILLLAGFLAGNQATAQAWRTRDGALMPPTDARKAVDGFSAMVLVTPDMDWRDKWETPVEVIPEFREADRVARDERLAILILFSNPAVIDGRADSVLDLRMTQPDGKVLVDMRDLECFTGALQGDPANVRLCATHLGYIADPDDPSGTWRLEVVVKDRQRGVEIPLKAQFEVLDPGVRAD